MNTLNLPATSALAADLSRIELSAAINEAMGRIPPLWPLKNFVAVNPFVGLTDRPFAEACALLQRTTGGAPLQSPTEYLTAFRAGKISLEALEGVADAQWPAVKLIASLEAAAASAGRERPIATVADLLDRERPHAHWGDFIVGEISKWCGAVFDENQTTWQSPWKKHGLFAGWREAAMLDRNAEAFGLADFRAFVSALPEEAEATIERCLTLLAPERVEPVDFFHRQLATVSGWAGYMQYLVREDGLRGKTNPAQRDLLAIRLAYDAALFQASAGDARFRLEWKIESSGDDAERLAMLTKWQCAYEAGYQNELAQMLRGQARPGESVRPSAQAVFCIDVRSEVFRRHLEAGLPGVQTIGFAGFFGFPIAHRPADATGEKPTGARCPVLLVPSVETCEPLPPEAGGAIRTRRAEAGAWKAFQNSAASCFSFVETAGLAFGAVLGRLTRPGAGPGCVRVAPAFTGIEGLNPNAAVAMAEGALRNMSLTGNFARLVLICGHGSRSANNPYASSLDCGACGGHAGDVNARIAAGVFNRKDVRALLVARGITIPDDTVFIAGLHDTTSDDVVLFDLEKVPGTHAGEVTALRAALASAGAATRRERAPKLGLAGISDAMLDQAVRLRARDASQIRPEWGLANNAALIAAPRWRTARLKLEGRIFLHDYDASTDPELKVLTLILCAPVVVASWINLQYYASRVDPLRYGSGNKTLHNVAGGIGVMEGNGGDLKTGLPLQSIHDGQRFVHEPRRLAVYIEASPYALGEVLGKQPAVRQLFDHGWLRLIAIEGDRSYAYARDGWLELR